MTFLLEALTSETSWVSIKRNHSAILKINVVIVFLSSGVATFHISGSSFSSWVAGQAFLARRSPTLDAMAATVSYGTPNLCARAILSLTLFLHVGQSFVQSNPRRHFMSPMMVSSAIHTRSPLALNPSSLFYGEKIRIPRFLSFSYEKSFGRNLLLQLISGY